MTVMEADTMRATALAQAEVAAQAAQEAQEAAQEQYREGLRDLQAKAEADLIEEDLIERRANSDFTSVRLKITRATILQQIGSLPTDVVDSGGV